MKPLFLILFSFIVHQMFGQDHVQKLLINEYNEQQEISRSFIVSYNFRDGVFVSKDTLFERPKLITVPFIHQHRYLISSYGPIYDMVAKKIIWESDNQFSLAEVRGDTIFYKDDRSDLNHPTYHFLDLKNFQYTQAPKGSYKINYNTYGSNSMVWFSPNNQKSVYPSYRSRDERDVPYGPAFHLVFREKHYRDTIIARLVHSANSFNVEFSRVALFWLNNSSFLYDQHHFFMGKDHKGYHQMEIHQYDSNTRSDRILCRVDSAFRTNINRGVFRRDAIGQLHYRANDGNNYLLDTVRKQVSLDPFFYLNKDFSFSKSPLGQGITIHYKDSVIAEKILGFEPVTADHSIAVIYRDEGPWLGYSKGIKIWTAQQNHWITFDVPWPYDIIGWINEP